MMNHIAYDLEMMTIEITDLLPSELQADALKTPVSAPSRSNIALQSESPTDSHVAAFKLGLKPARFGLSQETEAALGGARDWSEVRLLLQSEIEKQIVEKRFSEYQQSLDLALDDVIKAHRKADGWTPERLDLLPDGLKERWMKLEQDALAAFEKMASIKITYPENPRWWWSGDQKREVKDIELERSGDFISSAREQIGYDALLKPLQEQLSRAKAMTVSIKETQAEIEAKFESFKGTIDTLLGPLNWLPLKMADLVLIMPLLVAISLGAGTAWMLVRRRAYLQFLDTCKTKSAELGEIAFTMELDTPPAKLKLLVLFCSAVALGWILYDNGKLAAYAALEQSAAARLGLPEPSLASPFLNWYLSLALLAASLFVSLKLLASRGPGRD